MKRIKVLFIHVIILTAISLLLRTIGISFRVYLSNKIGPAGMGLYQLILSIYYLSITFSTSGIKLAATRLVAEELALGRNHGAKRAIKTCLLYSILFSSTICILLSLSAEYIGTNWLGDGRTVLSLRILAFCLPFLSMSSVFSGYFTAVRRAAKAASVEIIEQMIKISVTVFCLSLLLHKGLEYACAAIVIGAVLGECSTFLLLFLLYRFDVRRYKSANKEAGRLIRRMLHITLPVALSSYFTSGIHTLQQILIPYGLKKSGTSGEAALSTYGIIHGMVLPIIMFPSALLSAISDLIVPELAECQACGSKARRNYIITRVLNMGLLSSLCVMCIFFRYSDELGMAIYNHAEAVSFIRLLAPIIPFMYLDRIVDSIHKGIGEQVCAARFNMLESFISLTLIYFLLPKFAIGGYLFALFFTKMLNFTLSMHRLIKVIDLKISILYILKSLFCILCSIGLADLIFISVKNVFSDYQSSLVVHIIFTLIICFCLLRLLSCITRDDLQWLGSIFK